MRVYQFIQREFKGVHQAAFLLALATIAAKALALFRDRILASTFGAGEALDIYYASFRVPDFLYTASLFLAASTALIPLLIEREQTSRKESRAFIGQVISWFLLILGIASAILFFLMPTLSSVIAPGFSEAAQDQVVLLSRILLLQVLFLGLSNIASSIVQSFRLFFVYALSPILYNLGIIFGILVLYPVWGLPGLVGGVVIGAVFHFAVQVPSIIRVHFIPRISFRISPALRRAISLSLPRTLGLSLNQLVFIVITALASLFGFGSIAVFQLSYNLQAVPLSIIGLSYSVAAFPFLAHVFAKAKQSEFIRHVSLAFRHILFWSLPLTVLFIILRAHIVRVILGAGNFGWVDTRLTAAALALFSLSLLAQALIMLYVRAFYAAGRTILPVAVNVVSAGVIIGLSFFFARLFDTSLWFHSWFTNVLRVEDLTHTKVLVLPFAFSLGNILNVVLLALFFYTTFGSLDGRRFWRSLVQIIAASALLGVVMFYNLRLFDDMFNLTTFAGVFLQAFFAGTIGIGAAAGFLFGVKNRELQEIRKALFRKIKRFPIFSEPSSGTSL